MVYRYYPYLPTKAAFETRYAVFEKDALDLEDLESVIMAAFKKKRLVYLRGYVIIRNQGEEEEKLMRFTCPYEMTDLLKLYGKDAAVQITSVSVDTHGRFIYGKY